MNIEVGMYVRTENGKITKVKAIIQIESISGIIYNEYTFENGIICSYGIKKASYNIIDLIEEGDYVNGKLIHFIGKDYVTYENGKNVKNEAIKEILTKEQYNANKYEVE
jgi:hypothetical protein